MPFSSSCGNSHQERIPGPALMSMNGIFRGPSRHSVGEPHAGSREQPGVDEGAVAAQAALRAVDHLLVQGRDTQGGRLTGPCEGGWCQRRDRPDKSVGVVPGVGQRAGEGSLVRCHDRERKVIGIAGQAARQPAQETGKGSPLCPVGAGDLAR